MGVKAPDLLEDFLALYRGLIRFYFFSGENTVVQGLPLVKLMFAARVVVR